MRDTFNWSDISGVPSAPGIYAWYYLPEVPDYDLTTAIERVQALQKAGDRKNATATIECFLESTIFQYFQEKPFSASLRGPLKPTYEGVLNHKPSMSGSLIDRLLEDPTRLRTIKDVLESSAPNFSSPLYIGMSEDLNTRLLQHKRFIEKYREQLSSKPSAPNKLTNGERGDQSFALEVATRGMPPSRLFAKIQVIADDGHRYVDLENILNRIHYPLLGRN